jgi:hypothetical protein
MQGMTKSLSELFAMLKTAKVEIKKEHNVLLVNKTMDFKKSGKLTKGTKGKKPQRDDKRVAGPPKAPKMKPRVKCFYCKGDGHWKRNLPKYLEDKKAGKVVARDKAIFDIHVIDIYLTSAHSNTWVFDTGSGSNICNSQQDLRNKWRLGRNEVTMRAGNGQCVDVVAIATLHLWLPSGMILVLNKCYYVPALSMNIVSGSWLSRDEYHFESVTNGCSISKDDIFYIYAPVRDDLYILDLVTHINSVDAKRCKHSDDNAMYTWHCRLGHVGIKHMKKLHTDGLLGSMDFDSFDTCEPCLLGKMTRTPFTGLVEWAYDLLESYIRMYVDQ